MHLYVGNLAPTVTEGDLRLIFEGAGEVVFTQLDPAAGRPAARGYAYVAVADATQAQIAVTALHGRYLKGAALVVEAVAERARVGARQQTVSRSLPATAMASRRNRAAALGLYLVKNDT
jgi:RNA recognition motif-containing protein